VYNRYVYKAYIRLFIVRITKRKDEAVKSWLKEPLLSQVLKKRICFVEEKVLKKIGLVGKRGGLKHKKEFK